MSPIQNVQSLSHQVSAKNELSNRICLKLKPQKRKKPEATETNHRLAFAYKCVWSGHSRGQNTRVNVKGFSGEFP